MNPCENRLASCCNLFKHNRILTDSSMSLKPLLPFTENEVRRATNVHTMDQRHQHSTRYNDPMITKRMSETISEATTCVIKVYNNLFETLCVRLSNILRIFNYMNTFTMWSILCMYHASNYIIWAPDIALK